MWLHCCNVEHEVFPEAAELDVTHFWSYDSHTSDKALVANAEKNNQFSRSRYRRFFTITTEIHTRSLANFYCQYADRHMNLKFMRQVSERERVIRQFVIAKLKQIDVIFLCVCPVIDNEFRQNLRTLIVKVVCGSTATLTMLWRNSWSITGQTHKNWRQWCLKVLSHRAFWIISHLKFSEANLKTLWMYAKDWDSNKP